MKVSNVTDRRRTVPECTTVHSVLIGMNSETTKAVRHTKEEEEWFILLLGSIIVYQTIAEIRVRYIRVFFDCHHSGV